MMSKKYLYDVKDLQSTFDSSIFLIHKYNVDPKIPSHDIEEHGNRGEPIWVKTRSNHCRGPLRCSSIQQGVDVTVWRLKLYLVIILQT